MFGFKFHSVSIAGLCPAPKFSTDGGSSGSGAGGSNPTLKEGETLGHYTIRELVGEGPFGRVYKALDTQFDVVVALKIIHPELARDQAIRRTTIDVFRSLSELDKDGVVKIYDAFNTSQHLVIAADYLEGLSLRRLMEVRVGSGGIFQWAEAEPIISALCATLENLAPGSVHGDLKPENVVIQPDAITVTDLGLARIADPAVFVERQRKAGPCYLAPELDEHAERLLTDPAVDVYAVGAILYQLLTGQIPGDSPAAPSSLAPEIPEYLESIITQALSPNPDDRQPNIPALHLDIARFTGNNEQAAQAEIALSSMPDRERLTAKAAPEPEPKAEPEPAPEPKAEDAPPASTPPEPTPQKKPPTPSRSLFDDDLLSEGNNTGSPAETKSEPQNKQSSKTPLFAALGVVLLLLAGGAFFVFMGGEMTAEQAAEADLSSTARAAYESAEEARDQALTANANQDASELFAAGLQQLRLGSSALRDDRFPDAVTLAEQAEKTFIQARDESLAAQEAEREREARAAREREQAEAARRAQTQQAQVQPTPARTQRCPDNSIYIPAGTFTMGSPADDFDRNPGERENERVRTDAYCIDKYEHPNRKGARPTRNLNWSQANQACESAGKRLCSEAEWERACKGPRNLKFPYGNEFNADTCNTRDASGENRSLAPSGQFSCESGYGVHDMSGNVWEWTSGRLQSDLNDMILRGGSHSRPDFHVRCANRYNSEPGVSSQEFGVRCCANPNE